MFTESVKQAPRSNQPPPSNVLKYNASEQVW